MDDLLQMIRKIDEEYKNETLEDRKNKLIKLWNQIPESKENVKNAYLLIEKIVAISIKTNNLDAAQEWAEKGLIFSEIRNDVGEVEFLLGKIAYLKENFKKSKDYFLIANTKSKGKIFQGEDPLYKKLLKEKI